MNTFIQKIKPASLLRYTIPSISMMVFNSFYTIVDGIFLAYFVNTSALSAINIVFPLINIVFAIGIMLATGGSTIVAKLLGQGYESKARRNFSLIVIAGFLCGVVLSTICSLFTKEIVLALGANEVIYQLCYDYAFYLSPFIPFAILQMLFQFFFVTARCPKWGILSTIAGGITNICLDYLFIGPMQMGIKGAALATGIGFAVPAVLGLIYFFIRHKSSLYFVRPQFSFEVLFTTCTNGASEMVSNLSLAATTLLFNLLMMYFLGENGVAAITIVFYAQFIFTAFCNGYTAGVAPLLSHNLATENYANLRKILTTSCVIIAAFSIVVFIFSSLFSFNFISVFAPRGTYVYGLAAHGIRLFSTTFLFIGLNIFVSGLFSAFSNSKVSALLTFLRTFVFILLSVATFPTLFGVTGVWLTIPIAELAALIISIAYLFKFKKQYHY